jgi:hypothetical protein
MCGDMTKMIQVRTQQYFTGIQHLDIFYVLFGVATVETAKGVETAAAVAEQSMINAT